MDDCSVSSAQACEMYEGYAKKRSGDLEDDKVRAEYERGYGMALAFFNEHLN